MKRAAARGREHLAGFSLPIMRKRVLVVGGDDEEAGFFADRGCDVTLLPVREGGLRAPSVDDAATACGDPFEVVVCRDALDRFADPAAALRAFAARCSELLLLDAAVAPGRGDEIVRGLPPAAGMPTRRWLHRQLRELFECVYLPRSQPAHAAYPRDWRSASVHGRAVLVGSRMPLAAVPLFAEDLIDIQYPPFPHPAALATLPGSETSVVDTILGPLITFTGDAVTEQLGRFGAHTRNELALLQAFVDGGDLVYDIGGHIGTFAIPLAAAAGEAGRVVVAEAVPSNYALLVRNLLVRDLAETVVAVNAVVGDAAGARYRVEAPHGRTSASRLVTDPAGPLAATVSLDDLHLQCGAQRPAAVVKVDVEGMELAVLRSGGRLIARDRPVLHVEVSAEQLARHGATRDALEGFLRALGYRLFRNVGARNSAHDDFRLAECADLAEGGALFDVLAVAEGHVKLARAIAGMRH